MQNLAVFITQLLNHAYETLEKATNSPPTVFPLDSPPTACPPENHPTACPPNIYGGSVPSKATGWSPSSCATDPMVYAFGPEKSKLSSYDVSILPCG